MDDQDRYLFIPLDGGAPQALDRLPAGDQPLQWTVDGHGLYVRKRSDESTATIYRFDLATGRMTPFLALSPPTAGGPRIIISVFMTRDGRAYAYGLFHPLSDLYIAEGFE